MKTCQFSRRFTLILCSFGQIYYILWQINFKISSGLFVAKFLLQAYVCSVGSFIMWRSGWITLAIVKNRSLGHKLYKNDVELTSNYFI